MNTIKTKPEIWLDLFTRLVRENHINEFRIDWSIVYFHYIQGDSPESTLISVKENLLKGGVNK